MSKNSNMDTTEADVRWDLTSLYTGHDDPQLNKDIEQAEHLAKHFHDNFRGKLDSQLGEALKTLAEIHAYWRKAMLFLSLKVSANLNEETSKTAYAAANERLSAAAGEYLQFFAIELANLNQNDIDRQAAENETVAKHLPMIREERRKKPHQLSEEVEKALSKRSPFGPQSWDNFYDEVDADLRIEFDGKTMTLTDILDISAHDTDAERRASALAAINDGLGGYFLKFSAQTLNVIARSAALENTERNYPHPMAARNMENMIPDEVVEALHESADQTAGPLARRYYRLKAALLGQDKLRWSDRNAPLPFKSDELIPWSEAVDTVLEAYGSFSPTLQGLVRHMIEDGRIDAPAVPGKRSGAFANYTVLTDGTPIAFNLLNYKGRTRDVMTMAHELGHAVHGLLAGEKQGILQFDAPMAYAETASIFGERVTFDHLLKKMKAEGNKEAMLSLLCENAEDFLNSVTRQISFSNFEQAVHGAGQRLSTDEMNDCWMQVTRNMYGENGDVFTFENTERLWSYVPHFHWPFYVYAYAAGKLFTDSLYAVRHDFGDDFEGMYLELLRAGGTKDANELLTPFGLKPDREFWDKGIKDGFGNTLDEIERLTKELGYRIN
jgi:oligoendopeptidase F